MEGICGVEEAEEWHAEGQRTQKGICGVEQAEGWHAEEQRTQIRKLILWR